MTHPSNRAERRRATRSIKAKAFRETLETGKLPGTGHNEARDRAKHVLEVKGIPIPTAKRANPHLKPNGKTTRGVPGSFDAYGEESIEPDPSIAEWQSQWFSSPDHSERDVA